MGNKNKLVGTIALALSMAAPSGRSYAHEPLAAANVKAETLEEMVLQKPALFDNVQLSADLKPMVDFYARLYTETDNAIVYNKHTYEIISEVPVMRVDSRLLRSELRRVAGEKEKAVRPIVRAKKAKHSDYSYLIGRQAKLHENFDRIRPWIQHIRRELAQNGMSENVLALPILESMLNPNAISRAKAVGISQFMLGSGKLFMTINDAVDERLDPVYEMRATARYLSANFARYGRESHAIGAYHSGIGNYDRATKWAQATLDDDSDDEDLFRQIIMEFTKQTRLRGSFKSESQKYVLIFKGVQAGLQKHFAEYLYSDGYEFDQVEFQYSGKEKLKVAQLANDLHIGNSELSLLNPAILYLRRTDPNLKKYFNKVRRGRVSQVLPQGYAIRLPLGMGARFLKKYSGILQGNYETYRKTMRFDATVYNTPPDMAYNRIIERRKNGNLAEITREELVDVRDGYTRLLKENHLNYNLSKWLQNKLAVVEHDIYQHTMERQAPRRGLSHMDKLAGFSRNVIPSSQRLRHGLD